MGDVNSNEAYLPDYIDYGLKILSVGLNPSISSAKLGFYFANPRNRFWKAFNQARIIDVEVIPAKKVHNHLLEKHGIGFTDVAKRVSAMGHELRAADFTRDAPALRKKIERYAPEVVWFHGKVAMSKFMHYSYGIKHDWQWGFNKIDDMNSKVFVSPNPSPANAAYSLDVLVDYYKKLKY
jgi:TDG/mug DNA glycosylase family protein